MANWTKEQERAINEKGTNIIVSAGAGSGKTAVLTERVIEHLKNGVKINELLILTFTNAAASEMKERIRTKISDNKDLIDNLDYLDTAYITTFDSFSLSLVKKYNYLLNVSKNINIVPSGIINIKKEEIIDNIFNDLYEEENKNFYKLINDFTVKNDNGIKGSIIKLINSLELISNKEYFLDNYFEWFLSDSKIEEYFKEYNELLKREIDNIESNLIYLDSFNYDDYYKEMVNSLDKLIKSNNYDDIKKNIPTSMPRRPRGSDDIVSIKDSIDESLKRLKELTRFNNLEEIEESLLISKEYIKIIIEILKRYYKEINEYKKDNDLYEFTDIELMVINLVKSNFEIKEELKNSFYEICIDEYQDTNDLQEEFIKLISNNNLYMVGDIKQSIYRFRNANPSIFKDKYDNYSLNNGGIKIDLLNNFRSRCEVINSINEIFSHIMDDDIGKANYKLDHEMIASNKVYSDSSGDIYNLEIYNYNYDDKKYSKDEIEIFTIGSDIKNKIDNKFKVIDKKSGKLRECSYKDFCIILDRGSSFSLYKKIFEYLGIPLGVMEDKVLTSESLIYIIKNILTLILKIKDNIIDIDFKYAFTSISRSYLFSYSDEYIYDILNSNNYKDVDLYKICDSISKKIDILNSYELLDMIVSEFNIYDNLIKVGDIENSLIKLDNLYLITKDLSNIGLSILEYKEYLDNMLNSDNEITYKDSDINTDSVLLMNIHKSKGLEFPICYYAGLYKEFNKVDIKERFTYDNTYGIITPYYKDGIDSTILKDLLKDKYNREDISERIRLFYVALTRCREKMIIITNMSDNKNYVSKIVDNNIRLRYNSFLSIVNSISGNLDKYIKNINLDDINLTKDYYNNTNRLDIKGSDIKDKIEFKSICVDDEEEELSSPSVKIDKLISVNEKEILDKGLLMHKAFEDTDFLNIDNNNPYKDIISKFVKELNINKNTIIYKEHEFIYNYLDKEYHGIIDLVLINDNLIKIVDYKLKDISIDKYYEQLKIYYEYLKSIYDKEIEVYLYSITDNKLEKVAIE